MSDHSRSTALDPDLLTAEISLLLDYLSGLPERILTSHRTDISRQAARLTMTLSLAISLSTRRSVAMKTLRHRNFNFCSICVTISIAGLSLLPALR